MPKNKMTAEQRRKHLHKQERGRLERMVSARRSRLEQAEHKLSEHKKTKP